MNNKRLRTLDELDQTRVQIVLVTDMQSAEPRLWNPILRDWDRSDPMFPVSDMVAKFWMPHPDEDDSITFHINADGDRIIQSRNQSIVFPDEPREEPAP